MLLAGIYLHLFILSHPPECPTEFILRLSKVAPYWTKVQ